ncbi:MAG TPA: hypothetical protein VNF68_13360 [Candidatus Baltobacteraceae bacterium]|nr:hypothetical protein [Candidatus Baltobacteraceae bacterium]
MIASRERGSRDLSKTRWIGAAIALAVSLLPWVYQLCVVARTTGEQLEGAYYVAAFIGAVSFGLTGPLIAMLTATLGGEGGVSPTRFALEYWLIALPTLSFQVLAYSASILISFFPDHLTSQTLAGGMSFAAVLAAVWYGALFSILRPQVLRKSGRTVTIAAGFLIVSIAILALRVVFP